MTTKERLIKALQELRPGAEWVLYGDSIEGLVWHDKSQTQPTVKEISDALPSVQSEKELYASLSQEEKLSYLAKRLGLED